MRYVVYGAGAVGGVIGGRLFEHGHDVVLIARGAHLDALRSNGLELQSPDGTVTLPVPAAGGPAEAGVNEGDVVILAMKGQDTPAALDDLTAAAAGDVPVVCAQNGVENERAALRRFRDVYAMTVMLPGTHLSPGVVQAHGTPLSGILDLGRYPFGIDDLAKQIAADLDGSHFSSRAVADIMRSKYRKLLMNLANAIEAAVGHGDAANDLAERARAEAMACFATAGIDVASAEEDRARRGDLVRMKPIDGNRREGGSSWQSLARGSGRIEADYLNGEIVLLGRLHGVPTPVNQMLQEVANRMARQQVPPASLSVDDLFAQIH